MPLSPPRSLSPSKVSSFTDCPLAFRFSVLERLPEPPSVHAVRGTLVHAALERLFWYHPAGQRSEAAAQAELDRAWDGLQDDPELLGLELTADAATTFRAEAAALVRNYFRLEDPNLVDAVGMELGVEDQIGDFRLRGIIDRLDRRPDGALVVVDYKTGRAPSARFEQGRMTGVHFYALLCKRVLGQVPAEVRLLYLKDPVAITAAPTPQSIRGHRVRAGAVWDAITRSCTRDDFRPRPSGLCNFCHFRDLCPAHGGTLPAPAPASRPADGAAATVATRGAPGEPAAVA